LVEIFFPYDVMLVYVPCNMGGCGCMVVELITTMYLYNQCLSLLTLWVQTTLRWGVLDTTLCDNVCQWFETGQWFSPGTSVSSTNKTEHHDITEILLKVALSTIKPINLIIGSESEAHSACIYFI
jgi:hypothetical protein